MKPANRNLLERWWHQLKLEARQTSLERQGSIIAIVVADIKPLQKGRIKYQATYWYGRCETHETLYRGMLVEVIRREGNTWIVRSISL